MPLTIFFSSPGTYTIDDDGIRGNGVSVVRDAAGNVLFPFTHPGDEITFIAEVPGINFIFNVLDSFGTANVNVGSLTDSNLSPDSITVRSLRSDAFITLASNGTIVEGGLDASADITAAGVILSAGTGVGTGANALETQVTFIEAETNTGGINLANFGSVQIGGLTPEVAGLNVVTSGNINFTTTGFILVADGTGASSIHGGDTSGNVTLTAIGPDSDIFSNIDQQVIRAAGGGVTLNAGRDIVFGTSGTNFNNDILATNFVTIRAGRDFQLDGTSDIRTGAFGGIVGGAIDIQAGRNINLSNLTGGLQTIQAFQGNLILTTGPGGVFFENATIPGAVQTSQDIILTADNVQINSGGLNTTGIGSVTIRPVTPGRAIDLGTVLDGPAALGLSDDEFDLLFTLNVNIGDADTGLVDFSAPLSPFIVDNLNVQSGNDILFRSTLALPRTLTLRAGDDIYFSPTASFASTNEGLVAFVDNAQADDSLGGLGDLGGTLSVNTPIRLNGNLDADTLNGSNGNEIIQGNGGNDILRGFGGNDILIGGTGIDSMNGGQGNDSFLVDAAADTLIEVAGEGTDQILASVSYVLAAGVSVEQLNTGSSSGTDPINLTGNELANQIFGNNGVNILDGGGGADFLVGRLGDDWFYVDNANDQVLELAGEGNDRVFASVSYVLAAGQSIEKLTTNANGGTAAINLTGNQLANQIYGNAGANTLDGKGGVDFLAGMQGNDFFIVDNAADAVFELAGEGSDRVFAAVSYTLAAGVSAEKLTTANNTGTTAIDLTGNELVNDIFGNDGVNILDGKGGNDILTGLGGADSFAFTTALGAGNVDQVAGFVTGVDKIRLENAIFTGLAAGALPAGAFVIGAGAADAGDRIVYNNATGALLFDVDGLGGAAAVQFATLATGLALTAGDFTVI